MPSPTQTNTPLAKVQPVKQELPALEQMRADLLSLEADLTSAQFLPGMNPQLRRLFQILTGSQRTIVDHLRLIVNSQRMLAQSVQKYVDGKVGALAAEVNTAFASLTEQPEPAAEATQESAQTAEPVAVEPILPPVVQSAAPTPSPNAPQMTVTPVVRASGRAQRQPATSKGGSK